ncbi:MAG: helicase-associated domain-containing protein [Planctomycetes bacterium]|nr:helicase-associated domain-containing protein [Planctomycetota bacterium]
MQLHEFLAANSKAQLQGYYFYWAPGKEMLGARERLAAELSEAMTDAARVRQRFDTLSRSQRAFLVALLLRDGYSGTVAELRATRRGRSIEDYEVENLLKSLQEAGYIARVSGTGGYASEVFGMPEELAEALRCTVAVEDRPPFEMLSLRAHVASLNGSRPEGLLDSLALADFQAARCRISEVADEELKGLLRLALDEHGGILTHGACSSASRPDLAPAPGRGIVLNRPEWKRALEASHLGTTGVLRLKDYGIDLEEEGLLVYQEIVYETALAEALAQCENDREVSLGADLIIDLDRVLELLRAESLEVTREGNVYKKIEERIAGQFVTARHPEVQDGSPVGHLLELSRKLQFFEEEEQRIVVDRLRRWVWRRKPFRDKVRLVFEIFRSEKRGQRWSFHQAALRESFLDHLHRVSPGRWLVARPFLTAVVARYLLRLEEDGVAAAFNERCTGDFKHETLVVPLQKLHHDLSYWVLHRLALLGLIDLGFKDGAFHSLRLSRLGAALFGVQAPSEAPGAPGDGGGLRMVVNPDFEVLLYPEAPDEASWTLSLFADRLDSDRVKRYRLTRESVKRGIVAGLVRDDMLRFLETNARGAVPPNVSFSVREWADSVELVRLQKVHLLRAQTAGGADRLGQILETKGIPYERLNDTTVMVRGAKNERAVKELQEHLRDHGLFVE